MFWKHWDKTNNMKCSWQEKIFYQVINPALLGRMHTIHLYNKTLGVVIGNVTSPKNQLKLD